MSFVFQTRKDHPPMTAAERQRRCRANGKGRHRGRRGTVAEGRAALQRFRERIAALEAAQGYPATQEQMTEILRARRPSNLIPADVQATPTPAPMPVPAADSTPWTTTWREGAD